MFRLLLETFLLGLFGLFLRIFHLFLEALLPSALIFVKSLRIFAVELEVVFLKLLLEVLGFVVHFLELFLSPT